MARVRRDARGVVGGASCYVAYHLCETLATDIAYSSLLAFNDIVNCKQ